MFSLAFCLVLVPWTIRNYRVFHLFQPLAPAHAEMPGEFVPRGYFSWLRTWIDDGRYIGPVLWSLDASPIKLDDIPDRAFDSAEEKQRVAALLEKYNHPAEEPETVLLSRLQGGAPHRADRAGSESESGKPDDEASATEQPDEATTDDEGDESDEDD